MSLNSVDFPFVSIDCLVKLFQPFSSTLEERWCLLCHSFSHFFMTQHQFYLHKDCMAFSSLCWETTLQQKTEQGQKHTLKQQPHKPTASPLPFFKRLSKIRSCFDAELVLMVLQLSWEVIPVFVRHTERPPPTPSRVGFSKTNHPAAAEGKGGDFCKRG